MPLPLLLAAAPAIMQAVQGLQQGHEADKLRKRDTTPPAFTEALQLGRQAAYADLPGVAMQRDQIAAGENATLDAGTRAGTSSQSILGLLGRADANRSNALGALATRNEAYHQQEQHALTGLLGQEAGYQQHDQQQFDTAKAALREASARNLYGAVSAGSQIATYGAMNDGTAATASPDGLNSDVIKTAGNKLAAEPGTDASGPDDVPSPIPKRNRYGITDPTALYTPSYSA